MTNCYNGLKFRALIIESCVAVLALTCLSSCVNNNRKQITGVSDYENTMAYVDAQLRYELADAEAALEADKEIGSGRVIPRSVDKNGNLALVNMHDWCSGFFPGILWQIYEYSRDDFWREAADKWTWLIREAAKDRGTHDLGFMIDDSFGKAFTLTGDSTYLAVKLEAANTLITRFHPETGLIRSWDHNAEVWKYPVIIDNLMNLPLLFEASEITGDPKYKNIAISHLDKTLANHFRPDHSVYHVVDYDPVNGDVRLKCTCQGYSDESIWSRGHGWAVYGMERAYHYTGDTKYLDMAKSVADYFLSLPNMPSDLIPYWDMLVPETLGATPDHPVTSVPRDASAAAILACAFYRLGGKYIPFADKILDSLNSDSYRSPLGSNHGFLLLHSTGHHPDGYEIDGPICYADYYYLEALKLRENGALLR